MGDEPICVVSVSRLVVSICDVFPSLIKTGFSAF